MEGVSVTMVRILVIDDDDDFRSLICTALEQEGYVSSEWGLSDNNRRAKYYKLTRAGRRQLAREAREWEQTTAILARFFAPAEES